MTTNLNFGDSDSRRLYITQKETVLRIQLRPRGSTTSVTDDSGIPDANHLVRMPNYPNPLMTATTISYSLGTPEHVEVTIFDARGRVIRLLESARRSEGMHRVDWQGEDSNGKPVASGLYVYQIVAGNRIESKAVVVQR